MQKKILLFLMAVLVICPSLAAAPAAASPPGGWITMSSTVDMQFGTYQQDGAHWKATEANLGNGCFFSRGWTTNDVVPNYSCITSIRITFYIQDTWVWWWCENVKVTYLYQTGTATVLTYNIDNYGAGAYITVYLGASAKGHKLVFYYDDADHSSSDTVADNWYLDPPVFQYYTTEI